MNEASEAKELHWFRDEIEDILKANAIRSERAIWAYYQQIQKVFNKVEDCPAALFGTGNHLS